MKQGYTRPQKTNRRLNWILITSGLFIVCRSLLALVITTTTVTGTSMQPTLVSGQEAWVDKVSPPKLGDLVVIDAHLANPNHAGDTSTYVKRVLARPGDQIESTPQGLRLNDQPVYEHYLANAVTHDTWTIDTLSQGEFWSGPTDDTVPPGYVFVLGDNRNHSEDSRTFGYVPQDAIIGVAHPYPWDQPKLLKR